MDRKPEPPFSNFSWKTCIRFDAHGYQLVLFETQKDISLECSYRFIVRFNGSKNNKEKFDVFEFQIPAPQ